MTRTIGTLRRLARSSYQPLDADSVARQIEQSAVIGRKSDGSGDAVISVKLNPDGPFLSLPEAGANLLDWLRGHFPELSMAELGEVAGVLGPVIKALRDEAAKLSRTGKRASVLLVSAWPGRTTLERCANMLATTRRATFASLSWEERLRCAGEILRAHPHV